MKNAFVKPQYVKSFFCASAVLGLATSSQAALWTAGHGDFSVGFEDGDFEFGWHLGEDDDTATVDGVIVNDAEFESDEIQVVVTNTATTDSGTDQALLNGTGAAQGSDVFFIPQDSDGVSSVIVGVGTEELEQPAGVTWSDVTFTLNGVTGPGEFSVYLNTGNDFEFRISEALGIDSFDFAAGGHEELTWAFTESGTYVTNFTAEAIRTENGLATPFTSTGDFTFVVVPEPSSTLLVGLAAIGLLGRRRR